MKNLCASLLLISGLLLAAGPAIAADNTGKVKDAVASAEQWLTLVDNGQYTESWQGSAQMFRAAITADQWEAQLKRVLTPLGKVVSRDVLTASYMTEVPGAPKGEYVVIQFRIKLENGKSMTELVTPMMDPDGVWRVSGYYIK